jgi:predicted membrane protein
LHQVEGEADPFSISMTFRWDRFAAEIKSATMAMRALFDHALPMSVIESVGYECLEMIPEPVRPGIIARILGNLQSHVSPV